MARLRLYLTSISMVLMAALAACGGSDPPAELAFSRVALGFSVWPEGFHAARSAEQWEAIWAQRQVVEIPPLPMPVVDFGRHMVIGVSEGQGPTGCDNLRITRVTESDTELLVDYLRSVPHFDPARPTACTLALVPLVDFVVTKQSSKPVRFFRTQS